MTETFLEQFAIQLKHHREACSLSQSDVAARINIGDRTYQRFESGEAVPSLDIVFKLSQELKFSLKEIFSPDESIKQNPRFHFYPPEDETIFLNDSLVHNSRIVELSAKNYEEGIETIFDEPLFQSSSHFLAVASLKNIVLNSALQKKLGHKNAIVPAKQEAIEARERGLLWAFLIEAKCKYVIEKKTFFTPEGNLPALVKRVFTKKGNKYFLFCVVDFESVQ